MNLSPTSRHPLRPQRRHRLHHTRPARRIPIRTTNTINRLLIHQNANGASLSFWKTCLSSAIDGRREAFLLERLSGAS
jgi:hypothetical protein